MKQIGTYKGKKVYDVTQKEYIEQKFYNNEYNYYIINKDCLVKNNIIVGVFNPDNLHVYTNVKHCKYYTVSNDIILGDPE